MGRPWKKLQTFAGELQGPVEQETETRYLKVRENVAEICKKRIITEMVVDDSQLEEKIYVSRRMIDFRCGINRDIWFLE